MSVIRFLKKNSHLLAAIFFTFLGLFLRFKRLAGRDLWGDEVYQLALTAGPFKPIWQRFSSGDFTSFPGGYLINYPFAALFGSNKWLINIPHYFATFFGFFFLYLICRKYLKTFLGFAVAFLVFSFNGHLIFHSFEFRPYAVLPTLSLASFYFSGLIVSEWERLSGLKKSLIGAFFIFTIIYHAYGMVIVALCLLYFILLETQKSSFKEVVKKISSFLLPVGVAGSLLFIWYATGNTAGRANFQGSNIKTFDYYPNPANDFVHFIRQVFANLMDHKKYGQKHLALGIWISLLFCRKERFRLAAFFVLLIVVPILIILTLDLLAGYWFLDRQFVWVMSLYAFLLGWCWDAIFLSLGEKIKKLRGDVSLKAGLQ